MKKIGLIILLLFCLQSFAPIEEFCGIRNLSFQHGENITFSVFYSVIGLYVNGGTANFSVNLEQLNNKPVYHVVGVGNSNPSYDWIFKVRDRYETFIDTATMLPVKFIRNISEGGFKKVENITFLHEQKKANTTEGSFTITPCIQDVLSSIYYARNIDFSKTAIGDKIPFTMFLDNTIYNLYIKYLGKEIIKTRYGKYHAIKFKPLLVKGTIFEGGEKMTVWVSDDENHIPLRIESPIIVGSLKVDMKQTKNLRYPLVSEIKTK